MSIQERLFLGKLGHVATIVHFFSRFTRKCRLVFLVFFDDVSEAESGCYKYHISCDCAALAHQSD